MTLGCSLWYNRGMKSLKILIVAVVLSAIGFLGYNYYKPDVTPSQPIKTSVAPTPVVPPTPEEMLVLVNKERAKVGVALLTINPSLNLSAHQKADDMVKNNYRAHANPVTGKHGYEYITESGIKCTYQSENLYWSDTGVSAQDSVTWWLNSPSHKAAMLDPKYDLTGFAVSGTDKLVFVEHFCQAQ